MESLPEAKQVIFREITGDEPEVRNNFLNRYSVQVDQFSEHMAHAIVAWRELTKKADKHDKYVFIINMVYCAISLNIQSMKLFLAGHIVAAGNLSRQIIEAISLSLLSSGKELNILDRFVDDRYSTNDAVRDIQRHWAKLNLLKPGVDALKNAEKFYHQYSHMSKMTIASVTPFIEGGFYVGASFDEGKLDAYDEEIKSRLSLAEVFPNFVEVVSVNLSKWIEK